MLIGPLERPTDVCASFFLTTYQLQYVLVTVTEAMIIFVLLHDTVSWPRTCLPRNRPVELSQPRTKSLVTRPAIRSDILTASYFLETLDDLIRASDFQFRGKYLSFVHTSGARKENPALRNLSSTIKDTATFTVHRLLGEI